MSIRRKIFFACLSLTAVTLALGLVTLSAQIKLGAMGARLYDEGYMSMSYLRSAQNTVMTISRDLATGASAPDDLADRLDNAVADVDVARERAISTKAKELVGQLHTRLEMVAEMLRSGHRLPGRHSISSLEEAFDTAVEVTAGDGFRSRRAMTELTDKLVLQTWVAMGFSIACALGITALLSGLIVPAVRNAVRIASAIAAGHLDNVIEARGRSETAVMLRALAIMQRSIGDKIARIEQLMAEQASSYAHELAFQHARFEAALDNMIQGLCMFDERGRVLVHNRRFADMFHAMPAGSEIASALPEPLRPELAGGVVREARSLTRVLPDQRMVAVTEQPMDGGGWVATYEDVSARHEAEERVAYVARHDVLTDLPNRVLYREFMEHALAEVRRGGGLAVLSIDLDNFQVCNETLGHATGDMLLRAVAERLKRETREADLVVRLGGDEFAVVQSSATQPGDSKFLADRLVKTLSEPFEIDGRLLMIGASIGIAVTTDGQIDAEALLTNASLALSRAKADARGRFRFFETEMDAEVQRRRTLEFDLRQAVAERQFENFYQPLVDTATREICGFEALVRWRHPTRGLIFPGEFISVAEEVGLIAAIGALVLERACFDALTWPEHVKVAVNLSPLEFRDPSLPEQVGEVLTRSGLPARRLVLEITESLLLQDSESILRILRDIKALGASISMDDFGTGYSSLSYLGRFPFDKIKIDQSFIRRLDEREDCLAVVRAVLGLGKALGMRVIAEGVETEEQLAILAREGCEQVQGYLFSKPKPLAAVHQLLAARMPAGAVSTEAAKPELV